MPIAGQHWYCPFCMEMLAASIWIGCHLQQLGKQDVLGSSICLRSTAESRGSGRGVSPFHLSPGCMRVAGVYFDFGGCFVFVLFV